MVEKKTVKQKNLVKKEE